MIKTRRLKFESFEKRLVMAASAMEIYALSVVNVMRADPPAFGNSLESMIAQTGTAAHGYSVNDPVWTDLRESIRVSLKPSNVDAAINLLKSTQALPPLTWEDSLETKSAFHNDWMQNHCFTHSTPAGSAALPCFAALPGLPYDPQGAAANPDLISAETLGPWSSGSYSENIGYQSGPSMPATRAAHAVGSNGHRQRQAYSDIVNFVLEFNSSSLGHLEALLEDRRDAIGIDYALLDGFDNTSSATNFLATHTLSRNKDFGAYLTGLAYTDSNDNGLYDIGEHSSGCVTVLDVAASSTTQHCVAADAYGRLSVFLPAGQYQLTGGATTIAVDIGYVSENQNIDVTELLNDTTNFISFAVADSTATESAGIVDLRLERSGVTRHAASVAVTLSGTALGGSDYVTPVSTLITFAAGQTFADLRLELIDDVEFDLGETVVVQLGTVTDAIPGSIQIHTLTIIDNDPMNLAEYQALFNASVTGTHQVSGDEPYQVIVFVADRDATLFVQPSPGGPLSTSKQIFVVDATRFDLSSVDGQGVTADVVAGGRYAIVFARHAQPRSFDVSASPNDSLSLSLTNLFDFADVDGNGQASPLDALLVINELSRRSASTLPPTRPRFYNVNQDDRVSPLDALNVINEVARRDSPASPQSPHVFLSPVTRSYRLDQHAATRIDDVMADRERLF